MLRCGCSIVTHTPKDWTPGAKPIPTPHEGKIMVARPFITQEEQAEDCAQLVMKLGLPPVHLVTDAINTGLAYPMMINHPELWKSSILLAPVTLAEVSGYSLRLTKKSPVEWPLTNCVLS